MKKSYIFYVTVFLMVLFSGCAKIDYQSLNGHSRIDKNTSIVLLALEGNNYVNYFQFMADKFPPAMNYREMSVPPDIIALLVDTPLDNMYLGTITSGSAGYISIGSTASSYGYQSVESKPLNITRKGIYYYGVLNTDTQVVNHEINQKIIIEAKERFEEEFELLDLKPVNFSW